MVFFYCISKNKDRIYFIYKYFKKTIIQNNIFHEIENKYNIIFF